MYRYLYILLIIANLKLSDAAKILGISPFQSRSHNSFHGIILKTLASKGHEVISLNHFKSKSNLTNYQEIELLHDSTKSFIDSVDVVHHEIYKGLWNHLNLGGKLERSCCSDIFQNRFIQNLIKSHSTVDLIISEAYYTKCYNLLAYRLNAPLILLIAPNTANGVDNFLGNCFNPSYIPFIINEYTTKMNFHQRFTNFMYYAITYFYQFTLYDSHLGQLSRDLLNIELPPEKELNDKLALAFFNNHFSFIQRPHVPNAIDIGGIHITEAKPLSPDILEFIESAKHGVIFFSFGTTINSSSIPENKLQVLLDVFSMIPQKVLWRVNELNIANLPSNIKTAKWFPQRDILEHDNVVLFISHCGLFGTFEAIYTATPVLAIPFIYDQPQNAEILVEKQTAIRINFKDLNKKIFLDSIREMTNNQKYVFPMFWLIIILNVSRYKKNMINFSKIFRDRTISPLNTSVHWIEYIIRNKGAGHLKTPAANMPLYQYLLLDVIIFIILAMGFTISATKLIIRIILSIFKDSGRKCKTN